MFSTLLDNFPPFSSNFELSSANSFSLEESNICFLVKGPYPNNSWFLRVCISSFLKTLLEKKKLLVTSNFSLSHSVFYPFGQLSAILIKLKIVVCKVFQFGKVQNLLFGKGLFPKQALVFMYLYYKSFEKNVGK